MIADIPLLKFKCGSHICVFYRDETTLLDFLLPYVCEGLKAGEKCFLVQPKSVVKRLKSALSMAGVDVQAEIERHAIEIHSVEDSYLKSGSFNIDLMMSGLEELVSNSTASGFKAVRTAGDLGWAAITGVSHQDLLRYERLVQKSFPDKPVIGVCQYPTASFPAALLEEIVELHQASLQEPRADSSHSSMSIRSHPYTLDVVADRFNPKATVYYVVQKQGSTNIVGWGSEKSVENAIRMGRQLFAS